MLIKSIEYEKVLNWLLLVANIILITNNFIGMSGSQNKPARAASARPAPMRPTSSKNRKLHQKTEFIDNVYGQNNANDSSGNYRSFQKNKTTANKFNQLGFELEDLSRLVPKPDQMNKEKEQLF